MKLKFKQNVQIWNFF
ncbi:hypothetical protein ACJIZ3_005137 [Penstemon smallii]|uniref:Uncharacterized protein n=1 Tax=Penstemon smallii TaxID=265156 RepID=A0ABD3S482_9LAMI